MLPELKGGKNEMIDTTIFKGYQAFIRDFEPERIKKHGRIIQNSNIRQIYSTHFLKSDFNSADENSIAGVGEEIFWRIWDIEKRNPKERFKTA